MTPLAITFAIVCQFLLVTGQLVLKHAMNGFDVIPRPWTRVTLNFAAGVSLLSLWFFLWLGLLGSWELSHLFPFEGLNPALLVIGAFVFLKERVPPAGWVGIGLISVGVVLVSGN